MLTTTLQPFTNIIDELIELTRQFTQPIVITFTPGTITPASKLWIALYRVPLQLISSALATLAEGNPSPSSSTPPTEEAETQIEQAIDATEPANPQPEEQPQEPAAVEVPETEETTDPVCPDDAEQHNDGKFRLSRDHHGWKVERWKHSKKGEKYSTHYIPHGDRCDCKASEIYGNCCHQKAVDRELMRQKMEQERIKIESIKSISYRVIADGEVLKESQYLTHCEHRFNEHCKWGKIQESMRIEKVQGEQITIVCEFIPTPQKQLTLTEPEPVTTPGIPSEVTRELDIRDELFEQVSRLQWSVEDQKNFARDLFGTDTDLTLNQRAEMLAEMKKLKTPPKQPKATKAQQVEKTITALASLKNPPPF